MSTQNTEQPELTPITDAAFEESCNMTYPDAVIHMEKCSKWLELRLRAARGRPILAELEKSKKDLQEMNAKYLLATSPTKPI